MSYKPYEKYKPSGIEWIGEIPEGWEVKRLKWLLQRALEYGANESAELDDTSLPRYIRITDFGDNGQLRTDTFKSLPIEKARDYYLEEGDILFARSGATVGKTFQFKNYSGKACFAGYLIRARVNINKTTSDFLYYYTKSFAYENWRNSIFIQATIENIGAYKYNQLIISLPPLPEQQAIAEYLDKKTTEIDSLVQDKERLISLLGEKRKSIISEAVTKGLDTNVKMKPSGIDWIGDIPEGWEISTLRWFISIKSGDGLSTEQIDVDGNYPVIGGNGVLGYTNTDPNTITSTIAIGRVGALCGNIHKVEEPAWITDNALKIYSWRNFYFNYLVYSLENLELNEYANKNAQPLITGEMVKRIKICIPPLREQQSIAEYLDKKTSEIDSLVLDVEIQIEKLKEYRQAVISEAVTGKFDVRGDS